MSTTGEWLQCKTKDRNPMDWYAVAIKKRMIVIGHGE